MFILYEEDRFGFVVGVIGQGSIREDGIIASVHLGAELRWLRFGVMATILIGWAGGTWYVMPRSGRLKLGYDALFSG
ncbi:uncharacterized protein BO88DRAFT_57512 [Aspergillus vadensis CBS 113365]|uniref:Uncharacterized protein n=1 Tax=Aspergillus vadensis (strain CBS 113365 / IMI 142717 / IBT 24658) TaxID=1448311 RepID=A0A319BRG9_ASPVC|nr:hypothetical protein BO88DRAFT_57512 [Aspergillus vadensis CBS 113365]PYH68403.1 hypothetical protein BO88DRAFT_57512 [Aspergillus vadensis CBS 113365]